MKRIEAKEHLILPALLDALGFIGTGVLVILDRGNGLERLYANECVAQMLGYTIEEFEGIPPIDTIIPEQRPMVMQLSSGFRDGAAIPPALEFTAIRKDGSTIPVESRTSTTTVAVSGCAHRRAGTAMRATIMPASNARARAGEVLGVTVI